MKSEMRIKISPKYSAVTAVAENDIGKTMG
jgi:hypothetical protein